MTPIFYVNGHYVPEDQACLPVRDLAILRGYGVFDYCRTYGGQPLRLDKNLQRFRHSCQQIGMACPWSDADLRAIVLETLTRNQALDDSQEYTIRLLATGGVSQSNILPDADPVLLVLVQAFVPYPPSLYQTGVKIITIDINRIFPDAKTTLYTPAIMGLRAAHAHNAFEALYLSAGEHVLEATTSNIFAFYGDCLVTPPTADQVLAGVTRAILLELAAERFTIDVRDMTLEELKAADEVFLSSANKEVLGVIQVDEDRIAQGTVGKHTRTLHQMFRQYAHAHQSAHG